MKELIKNKKIILVIFIVGIIFILGFWYIVGKNERQIEKNINEYFSNLAIGNFEEANIYLDNQYDYYDNTYFDIENTKVYLSKFKHKIDNIHIEKDKAIVTIELIHPKLTKILSDYAQYLSANLFNDTKIEEQVYKNTLLTSKDLEYETNNIQILLKKKNNSWEIVVDSNFKSMIVSGKTENINNNSLTDNEKKKQELMTYIRDNLELKDYKVGYSIKYSDEAVPSIKNIEIKNNGNKEIIELVLQIDFIDDNGKIIATRTVNPISKFEKSLKPGYSWKLEDDEFYELTNLDKSINIEKCNVKISDITFGNFKEETLSDEQKYINEYMQIISFKVKKYEKYTGEILPGLGELEIKNNGGKDLSKVYVTVYFQDANDNNIAENKILVIGGLFSEPSTLKSNYSWKMENDKFYELTNLSSEVNLAKHTIEISEIEFAQ